MERTGDRDPEGDLETGRCRRGGGERERDRERDRERESRRGGSLLSEIRPEESGL